MAFTEHGAIMAATVLNSPRAVEMSVYVVRAFVKLRQVMENRFALVEQKIDTLRNDMSRDFAAQDLKMTVKLGSMLFVGFGLTIAAMRLWT